MVLGTSSGAGKSLMTAALCRVLKRRGETPLPFKGQNMSNNAWVDQNGGEMAYSQALQAWAAELEPVDSALKGRHSAAARKAPTSTARA